MDRQKTTKEMKKHFEFHFNTLIDWVRKRKDNDVKNFLWGLVKDSNKYSYSKGYQTGRKTGFAEGIAFQFKNKK